ncbi:cation:proton antiporter domain-containing protein [Halomarina pelagica]|uniref:cation:proton antiporter domain-containing protein n=1 Tax=Halomarina pelagica TaxID=2961599 RepID=UPI0020C46271|nr:cation:proton antiporter [Halomarina sp. BND7]
MSVPIQQAVEPIDHHALLVLLVQLFLLLLVARGLGVLATKANLPSVVGELLAGIVVGPSVLGTVAPGAFEAIFPLAAEQFHLLEVVSWIGLLMLLVLTGLETDLDLIVARAKSATSVAVGGVAVPFAFGFGLAYVLPAEFLVSPDQRLVFSLFVATAMSISSIPVIAKVLMDMDLVRRDIGQITLASGMINDSLGWIMLSVVAGLARSGVVDLGSAAETILILLVFLGVSFTLGRRLSRRIVRFVDNAVGGDTAKITTLMVLALGVGSLTHYLGIEAVLGAFVVGILVGDVKRFDRSARHLFEVVTVGVFAPIFFATAGLRVNLAAMLDPTVFAVGTAALGVAIAGKFVGTYLGAAAAGLSRWEGISLGAGMNARGAMEIIIATIGLSLGVLTGEMYTIVVMVAIVTSIMAPPLLRWTVPRIEMDDEEREAERERNFVANLKRVLVPTRGSEDSQFAARLVGLMTRGEEIEVTNMYLARRGAAAADSRRSASGGWFARLLPDGGSPSASADVATAADGDPSPRDDPARCFEVMAERLALDDDNDLRNVVREETTGATETVLAEAERGYDLLVLGAAERGARPNDPLFGAAVDRIVVNAPCPVMVVDAHEDRTTGRYGVDENPIQRILLPTAGMQYNRHAAEVAFAIARDRNAMVEIVHYVDPPRRNDRFVARRNQNVRSLIEFGEEIVDEAADRGRRTGVEVSTRVFVAREEPEEEMLRLIEEGGHDLVLMGSSIRPVSERAFFGHRVEYIIKNAPCPVAVLSSA